MRFNSIVAFYIFTLLANGATYYVAPTGSDANDGSLSTPWLRISHGCSNIASGDTLLVLSGIYTNDFSITVLASGSTTNNRTTVIGSGVSRPIIRPSVADDVGVFTLSGSSNICISGLEIDLINTISTKQGVKFTENGNHNLLTNCVIHHVYRGMGVLLTGGTKDNADYNEIINNTFYLCGWQWSGGVELHGIYNSSRYNHIVGNTCYSNNSHGIHFYGGTPSYCNVYKNTTYANGTGIGIYTGESNYCYNNIAYSNNVGFRSAYGASHSFFINDTAAYNTVNFLCSAGITTNTQFINCLAYAGNFSAGVAGFSIASSSNGVSLINCLSTGNINTNFMDIDGLATTNNCLFGDSYVAGFASPLEFNFRLLPSSAARNNGVVQAIFTDDFIGKQRGSSWDIGAYEFYGSIAIMVYSPGSNQPWHEQLVVTE